MRGLRERAKAQHALVLLVALGCGGRSSHEGRETGDAQGGAGSGSAGVPASGASAGATCTATQVIWLAQFSVELVVHTGASMAIEGGEGPVTRWEETLASVARALDRLRPANVVVGLTLYPGAADCHPGATVPARLLDDEQYGLLMDALANVVPGGTGSIDAAYEQGLEDISLGAQYPRDLLLITDTVSDLGPDCKAQPEGAKYLQASIEHARMGHGTQTRLLAVHDGFEAAQAFSSYPSSCDEFFSACFLDYTDQSDFSEAVVNEALPSPLEQSCTLPLASDAKRPPDGAPLSATLTLDSSSEALTVSPGCTSGEGFSLDAGGITLCPATCERARRSIYGDVVLGFGAGC